MRSAIFGFVLGVFWLQNQADLPSPLQLGLIVGGAAWCGVLIRFAAHPYLKSLLLAACGGALGFAWAALLAQQALSTQLPAVWEGRDVTVIGTIDSLPHQLEQGVRFNFAVERVLPQDDVAPSIPSRLALSWYAGFAGDVARVERRVEPGERWQLTVRLQRPHGNANPYGFDYEVWLLEQGLRATGYVRPEAVGAVPNRRLDTFVWSFGNVVETCRHWLRERIVAALPDKKYAGVIVALVVGDQRAVSQSDWAVFNRTGVSHLISISGLHITMIAGLFASLAFWLWRHSFFTGAQLPLRLPAQKAAALAGAGSALLYVLLAGFGVPAQRTLYMLSVVAAALWLGRITSVSHVLCLALAVVVVLDPWAVLWPGFWLSFGAVGLILYTSVGRTLQLAAAERARAWHAWRATLVSAARTQYAVTLGLVPLTVLLFAQVSLVSPLANAVAIPLVSLVVTPLALLGSVLPAPLAALGAERGARAGGMAGTGAWLAECAAAGGVGGAHSSAVDFPAGAGRHPVAAGAARLAGALDRRGRLAAAVAERADPSAGRPDVGDRLRRRPGHGAAGGNRKASFAVRHRADLFARFKRRQPGYPALSESARHPGAGCGGGEPQRQ